MTEIADTIYAAGKRFDWFYAVIQKIFPAAAPLRILEIGCGTGEGVLLPLAKTLGTRAELHGIDLDDRSIAHAQARVREENLTNLTFQRVDAEEWPSSITSQPFDVVITSEILEHVDNPLELLKRANERLKNGGLLLVTVPNGYGPFEIEAFVWNLLRMDALRRLWRGEKRAAVSTAMHTMNDENTHLGFYTLSEVKNILNRAGFGDIETENREFFCGPFSDFLTGHTRAIGIGTWIIRFSHAVARFLPSFLVADWMLAARKRSQPDNDLQLRGPTGPFKKWWWSIKRRQNRCPA